MRVFVTGATGVIGRRVVPLLVQRGNTVSAIGRSPEKRQTLQRAGARPVDVDLFDEAAMRAALVDHDAIINLATHMPSSTTKMLLRSSWKENDRIRSAGSATLVSAARAAGVERFVQESFAPIYVDNGDRWIDEDHPTKPVAYNRSILDAEESARRFTTDGGIGIVLRFAGFYGPDAFHIREMVDMIRKGWSPIPGRGEAFLSSISHDDAAAAAVAALDTPAGIYNVTDDEPLRRREWLDALATSFALAPPKLLPRIVSHLSSSMEMLSRSQRMSNRRLRGASSWAPRYPTVREGFGAMAAEIAQAT